MRFSDVQYDSSCTQFGPWELEALHGDDVDVANDPPVADPRLISTVDGRTSHTHVLLHVFRPSACVIGNVFSFTRCVYCSDATKSNVLQLLERANQDVGSLIKFQDDPIPSPLLPVPMSLSRIRSRLQHNYYRDVQVRRLP